MASGKGHRFLTDGVDTSTRHKVLENVEDSSKDGHIEDLAILVIGLKVGFLIFLIIRLGTDTHSIDGNAHERQHGSKRETGKNGCRLESAKGLTSSCHQQRRRDSTLGKGPEDSLYPVRFFESIGSEVVHNQGSRVGRGNKVDGKSEEGQPAQEGPEPSFKVKWVGEGIQDVEPSKVGLG